MWLILGTSVSKPGLGEGEGGGGGRRRAGTQPGDDPLEERSLGVGRAEPALEAGAASLPFPTVEASHVRGMQSPSLGGVF